MPRSLIFTILLALFTTNTTLIPASFASDLDEAGSSPPSGSQLRQLDEYTLVGGKNFYDGYPAVISESEINVVVEIPAGTNAKWEVREEDGAMAWEFKEGKPRIVKYLPYPGNYGMVPRTLLSKEQGGDGDPLDVIVLGPTATRGSVITACPIGILRLLDGGEVDDKVLAIASNSPLQWSKCSSLNAIRTNYPGLLKIVEIWFSSYKGPGKLESRGFAERTAAWDMIYSSAATFEAMNKPSSSH
jgi:inorganic pyrophosphatase